MSIIAFVKQHLLLVRVSDEIASNSSYKKTLKYLISCWGGEYKKGQRTVRARDHPHLSTFTSGMLMPFYNTTYRQPPTISQLRLSEDVRTTHRGTAVVRTVCCLLCPYHALRVLFLCGFFCPCFLYEVTFFSHFCWLWRYDVDATACRIRRSKVGGWCCIR